MRVRRSTFLLSLVLVAAISVALASHLARHRSCQPPGAESADAGLPMPSAEPPVQDSAAERNFNPGWIGAACAHDTDCPFTSGFCLLPEEGFVRGYCSARCQRLCPDRAGDLFSVSFCMEDPVYGEQGICVAGCNLHLTPSGCRPGYVCSSVRRLHDEEKVRLACLPESGTPAPPNDCTRELDSRGITYARPDLVDDPSHAARPGDPSPGEDTCQIDTPVLLSNPVHTIDYREWNTRYAEHLLLSCRMALVLDRLSLLLRDLDVVEVEHLGTYNCRSVAGTRNLSGHGHARAIDITAFERATGTPVSIRSHWKSRASEEGRFLQELIHRLRDQKIFDTVMTPDSGPAHEGHLHLEVR